MSSNKKKKILLLSDDMRMHSGVARMSREVVINTLHKYDWVQVGGAIKHPEAGNRVEIQSDEHFTLPKNASCVIYPVDGYGNDQILRYMLEVEKPDAILHFTDPRFWGWLYNMEHEVRQNIPIMYYNIWDDLPDPHWNAKFYRCSNSLMSISKQTYGINKRLLPEYEDWQLKYVPHGINKDMIYEIENKTSDENFMNFQFKHGFHKYKFKILYVNRNIRRKQPGDVVMAYKHFMDQLTPEQRKECCLIFHTAISDENGTDLRAVCRNLIPEYPVIFTHDNSGPLNDQEMNYLYNSCDIYMNIASNEGFGLGSLEALHVKKPIIVNVTGGLQDQCGFKKEDGSYLTADDYVELGSNHRGTYKEHGEWVKPVFPSNISLQGSPPTPYIFDDRVNYEDAGDAIRYWYDKTPSERYECGLAGYEYVSDKEIGMDAKHMAERFEEVIDDTLEKWKPREKYTLEVV